MNLALSERYLVHYIEQAWHVVEPKTPFSRGWHIDAICDHLQAVTDGHIKKLLVNIPPRHMKSLAVSVFWPTWEWGPAALPHIRQLYSSYAEQLSKRDSVACRRLIKSPWYQQRWGHVFQITSDQNEKLRFENDMRGYRVATSVGGMGTGEGGDRIVVDDPHNVKEGESEAKREGVLQWWDESMSTRLNDERTGAKVIVMQRLHEADLSGHVLSEDRGYVHLCLPARYEGNRVKTILPFRDPRTEQGEPLWPGKYPSEVLDSREKDMTEYAIAGQHQQRPAPRGGGMFKVEQMIVVDTVPGQLVRSIRYWDKAGTEGGGANTSGALLGKLSDDRVIILDIVKGQWSSGRREAVIRQTAEIDGKDITVWIEQEPGSGGKESAENTIKMLMGWRCFADRVTGSKEVRAEPYAAAVENGLVLVLNREWTKEFIREHEKFPMGTRKDQVDSAAGAFNKLHQKVKKAGAFGRR